MHIRNNPEGFHVDHVPDNVMPKLNSAIRYAVYDFFKNVIRKERELNWLALMAPAYWEVPGRDPMPEFDGQYLWEGKPVQLEGNNTGISSTPESDEHK
ncbi:hypothetical protein BH24CHL4_BH24CHL4_00140 [soil metagenome]